MKERRSPESMSVEQLERLLLEKKRAQRIDRLRHLAGDRRPSDGGPAAGWPPPADATAQTPGPASPFRGPAVRPLEVKPPKRTVNARVIRDRLLLVIEVAALIGLVVILGSSLLNLRELNRDVVEARTQEQASPSPSATALIRLLVELPGGHAPPVAGQEPVPALYRNLITPQTAVPIPTPGPEQASRIVIPAISVDVRVVEGDDWEALKKGAGHHIGSANPGERGNCVISAHDDIYGEWFKDLSKLQMGDEIIVYAGVQPYRYRVVDKRIILPTEVSVMDPTTEPVVTLITCYPYLINTHRIIVVGALVR